MAPFQQGAGSADIVPAAIESAHDLDDHIVEFAQQPWEALFERGQRVIHGAAL